MALLVQAHLRLTHISVGMNNEVLRVPQSGGDAVYEIRAVSLHSGLTDTSGHFVTLLKRGDQWWYIDDLNDPATCAYPSVAQFMQQNPYRNSMRPYLLKMNNRLQRMLWPQSASIYKKN